MSVHGYVDRLDVLPAGFAGPVLPSGAAVLVTGWALRAGRPPDDLRIVVDGRHAFAVARGLHRPDVAAAFGAPAAGAGFQGYLPTAPLGVGPHAVRVLADGTAVGDELPLVVAAAEALVAGGDLAAAAVSVDEVLVSGRDLPGTMLPSPAGAADTIVVRGWADTAGEAGYRAVLGIVDETTVFVGPAGLPRADVATFFGDPRRANCGFRLHLPLRHLGAGEHRLRLAFGVLAHRPLSIAAQRLSFVVVGA